MSTGLHTWQLPSRTATAALSPQPSGLISFNPSLACLRTNARAVDWPLPSCRPTSVLFTADDTPNVFKYICAAYTGPRPDSCFKLSEPGKADKAAEQGSTLKGLAAKQLTLRNAEYRRMMTQ